MLSFALTGTIGCIRATAPDELTLAIACVVARPDQPDRVAWVLCVARDGQLRREILQYLRCGDLVGVDGEIEHRRRQAGDFAFLSVGFVARSIAWLAASSEGAGS